MSKTYHTKAITTTSCVTNQFVTPYNRIPLCLTSIGGFVFDSRDGVEYTAIQSRCVQAFSGKTSKSHRWFFLHSTTKKNVQGFPLPVPLSKLASKTGYTTSWYTATRPTPRNTIRTGCHHDSGLAPIVSEMRHGDDNSCHDLAHAVTQSFSHSVIS